MAPFPRGDDLTFSIRRSSLLLPSPPCRWLGSITQHSPRKAEEHLFWEEFRQTNQPLRGTNRSMKMTSSAKRADDGGHLLSTYCMPDLGMLFHRMFSSFPIAAHLIVHFKACFGIQLCLFLFFFSGTPSLNSHITLHVSLNMCSNNVTLCICRGNHLFILSLTRL